jgi:DegV family protein with EDD domain
MDVAIVTDASTDLPQALAAAHGVTVARLGYTVGGKRYTSTDQDEFAFLAALEAGGSVEIGGVEADDFEVAFRSAAEQASHLICLCQSVGSSFTRVSAEVAARRLQEDGTEVDVISPGRTTASLAAIALLAGDAAQAGADAAAVAALVDSTTAAADTYLLAASLDQLEAAGQLSIVQSQSTVGRLVDGVPVFRLRGRLSAQSIEDDASAAEEALVSQVAKNLAGRPAFLVVTHADAAADAERLLAAASSELEVQGSCLTEAGPTVTGLLGRGVYGLGFCLASV